MKLNRRDMLKWLGLAPAAAVAVKVVGQDTAPSRADIVATERAAYPLRTATVERRMRIQPGIGEVVEDTVNGVPSFNPFIHDMPDTISIRDYWKKTEHT